MENNIIENNIIENNIIENKDIKHILNLFNGSEIRDRNSALELVKQLNLSGIYYNIIVNKDGTIHDFQYMDNSDNGPINQFLLKVPKKRKTKVEYEKRINGSVFQLINNTWIQVCFPLPRFEKFIINPSERKNEVGLIDELKKDFVKLTKNRGPFLIQHIFDGSIINVYFSQLHGYWRFGTRNIACIMGKEWRDIVWYDIFNRYYNTIESFDTSYTYIVCATDTRVHFLAAKNNFRIIAIRNESETKFNADTEITTKNLELATKSVFDNLKDCNSHNFRNEHRENVGYIFRFENNEDIIIPSAIFNHVEILTYRDTGISNKKTFYGLRYVITNSFCVNYGTSKKYFPNFRKYYDLILFYEGKLGEYLVDMSFGNTEKYENVKVESLLENAKDEREKMEITLTHVAWCHGHEIWDKKISLRKNENDKDIDFRMDSNKTSRLNYISHYLSRHRKHQFIGFVVDLLNPKLDFEEYPDITEGN